MKDYNNSLYETVEAWLEAKTIQLSEMDMEGEDDGKALLQYTGALGALRSLEGRDLANRVEVLSRSLSDVASVLRNCEAMDDNNLDSSSLPDYLEHVLEESKGVFALGAICQMAKGLSAVAPDWLVPEDIARGMILERIEPMMEEEEEEEEEKEWTLRDAYFADKPQMFHKGECNSGLYKYACFLLAHQTDEQTVLEEVTEVNKDRCEKPLPDSEVRHLVKSACLYERFAPKSGEKPLGKNMARVTVQTMPNG